MTQTPTARPAAALLAAIVALALWLPTLTVPAEQAQLAATDVAVELA